MVTLDTLDRRLIDAYQRGLPVCERPFAAMAERLASSEAEVLERLGRAGVRPCPGRGQPAGRGGRSRSGA